MGLILAVSRHTSKHHSAMNAPAGNIAGENSSFSHFEFDGITYQKYLDDQKPNKYTYSDIVAYNEKQIWPKYCVTLELKEEFCEEIKNFFVDNSKLCYRNFGPDLEYVDVAVVCDKSTQFEIIKQFHCAFHIPNQPHQPFPELYNILVTKYYWFNMVDDINMFIVCCRVCNSVSPLMQNQEIPNELMHRETNMLVDTHMVRNQYSLPNIQHIRQSISPSYPRMSYTAGLIPTPNNEHILLPPPPNIELINAPNFAKHFPPNMPLVSSHPRYSVGDNRNAPSISNSYSESFPFLPIPPNSNPTVNTSISCYGNPFPHSSTAPVTSYSTNAPKSTFPAFPYQPPSIGTMTGPPRNCEALPLITNKPPQTINILNPSNKKKSDKTTTNSSKSTSVASSSGSVDKIKKPNSRQKSSSNMSDLPNLSPSNSSTFTNHSTIADKEIKQYIDQIKVDPELFNASFNEMIRLVDELEGDMIGSMAGSHSSHTKIHNSLRQMLNVQMPTCLKFLIENLENNKPSTESFSKKKSDNGTKIKEKI